AFHLEDVITLRHLEAAAKLTLVTGWIVAYAYIVETFLAWYSCDPFEMHVFLVDRLSGPYAPLVWFVLAVNFRVPASFLIRKVRSTLWLMLVAAVFINLAMWTERLELIVTSLHQDFLPSSWRVYVPTVVDGTIILSTLFFFSFLFLAFLR